MRFLLYLVASTSFLTSAYGGGGSHTDITGAAVSPRIFQSMRIKTTLTTTFNLPSPDPTGVTYIPAADGGTGGLMIVDSRVDQAQLFAGKNVFNTLLDGTLLTTAKTAFSNEPTGITFDPAKQHLFYSDDELKMVFEVNPGTDGRYLTADDIVTSFSTSAYGSDDPEDIAFDTWARVLFVADGKAAELFRISPGANGRFDGVMPVGDDTVTNFDTSAYVDVPEGVAFNIDTGNLYVVGRPGTRVAEVTTSGTLAGVINISAAIAERTAGLTYAPASDGSGAKRIYIVDRGIRVDSPNRIDQNTGIDGRLYEMTLPPITPGNRVPSVNAGPDQNVSLSKRPVALDGSVGDDRLPNPPGAVTTMWVKRSGPGTVTFADTSALDTTASFSVAGNYVLRLSASDGQARGFDEATITVLQEGVLIRELRINSGPRDAEERVNGSVERDADHLHLMNTGGGALANQAVGLRFVEIDIPPGAQIVNAYIQFTAAEADTNDTKLTIQGAAADDAPSFEATIGNISLRPRTASAVAWAPPPWDIVGAVGPAQRTSNIAPVIQEIVNRPGWTQDNDLILILTGAGQRVAQSYNGSPTGAPQLTVVYTIP